MELEMILHITDVEHTETKGIHYTSFDTFTIEQITDAKAVVFDNHADLMNILLQVKKDNRDLVYLKPLFVWSDEHLSNPFLIEIVDGIIMGEKVQDYILRFSGMIDKINDTVKDLVPYHGIENNDEYGIELKAIRHLYSRGKELTPVRSSETMHGYTYPILQLYLGANSYQEFILIDFLKNRDMVVGTFVDKIHHCPHCYSAYLNFREICFKCGSADLYKEDLIHHFRCAYEGPESDFFTEKGLVCPKCHKALKQIGVDFDRPSEIYTCNSCKQVFQDPDVDVKCVHCGSDTVIDNILERRVEKYYLTALGKTSAQNGIMFTLKDELKDELDIVEFNVFKKMLEVERARIGRYKKSESSVIRITFHNYIELAAKEGDNLQHLNREIGEAIKRLTRTSDVISFRNNTELLLLFTETTKEWSSHALQRIIETLKSLILNSTQMELIISSKVIQIAGTDVAEKIIESLETND